MNIGRKSTYDLKDSKFLQYCQPDVQIIDRI